MMAFKTANTSIGVTAAKIVDGGSATPYDPIKVKVKTSSGSVFVGGSDVSSSNGFVVTTTSEAFELTDGSDLYAVASATATIQVFYNEKQ